MLRWYKPVHLSKLRVKDVPDLPGVYVLLRDPDDLSSVLKIGPARSLRAMFERELAIPDKGRGLHPKAMMFAETWADAEEAQRLIVAYKRKHGRPPVMNSPY
ncbi:hypothetical protein [Maricaulis maris]|uniref:GIY-YIG domain-containing protein n=1 Tax=Maricaulis maris TaxID=74318 RepID=A0A495DEC5_9PROT|nr:hypothetical protein [Maricaulis maris]RKR00255.1 hypothetical protein C7435_1459 [Maricaulis maris]